MYISQFVYIFPIIQFLGFDGLIHELNHMPMTAETLRVRLRKNEIEKELKSAEDEIRIYSKAKVYVKANKSRNL